MLHFKGIVPILESMPDYSSAIKFIYGFCVHMTNEDFKYLQDFFTIYTKIDGGAIDIYMDPKFTLSKASETWKLNGLYHNNNGPAKRSFYYDMTIEREENATSLFTLLGRYTLTLPLTCERSLRCMLSTLLNFSSASRKMFWAFVCLPSSAAFASASS